MHALHGGAAISPLLPSRRRTQIWSEMLPRSTTARPGEPEEKVMWITAVLNRYRTWRSYHRTVSELEALDQRELDDLGIGRWQIRSLARQGS